LSTHGIQNFQSVAPLRNTAAILCSLSRAITLSTASCPQAGDEKLRQLLAALEQAFGTDTDKPTWDGEASHSRASTTGA